jgi:hypothetical protein
LRRFWFGLAEEDGMRSGKLHQVAGLIKAAEPGRSRPHRLSQPAGMVTSNQVNSAQQSLPRRSAQPDHMGPSLARIASLIGKIFCVLVGTASACRSGVEQLRRSPAPDAL